MASGIKCRIEFAPAAETPRPAGVKKLEDEASLFRIRVGDYRVIYTIQDKLRLVLVITPGYRLTFTDKGKVRSMCEPQLVSAST